VVEVVLLMEAEVEVLHNLLKEERTPLNSNKLQWFRHLLMVC
jgi:hypothetical protein